MIHLFQCHAGHLVCSNCRPKLTCCPTCRGQLGGNIRNLAMEKVASTVMFPCRYQSSGCGLSLLHTEKTDHEETCEFRYWKKNIYNVMGISTKTIAACGERLKDFFLGIRMVKIYMTLEEKWSNYYIYISRNYSFLKA